MGHVVCFCLYFWQCTWPVNLSRYVPVCRGCFKIALRQADFMLSLFSLWFLWMYVGFVKRIHLGQIDVFRKPVFTVINYCGYIMLLL